MKKRKKTGVLLIVLAGTAAVVGVAATRVRSRVPRDAAAKPLTMTQLSPPTASKPPIGSERTTGSQVPSADVVIVSLFPTGFEPAEFTHPEGKFLFGVNNRTGLSDVTFQLVHESGRRDGQKRVLEEKIWRKVIEPKPGRYVLRVAGHPEWRCEIMITAR